MDVYTAAGKMRQDIAVSTSLVGSDGAGGLEEAVKRGVSGKTLCGVLVCQHSAIQWPDVRREVLDYEAGEMEDSWRVSCPDFVLLVFPRRTLESTREGPCGRASV